jgi:hypothetical protein
MTWSTARGRLLFWLIFPLPNRKPGDQITQALGLLGTA